MTTLRKIATETEAMLINEMAKDVRFDTDLGEEWHVAADLKNADWSVEMIYDYLDAVIDRARVIRATDAVASGGAGLFAAVSWAAFSWFVLWPGDAMAATLSGSDWPSVGMRFLAVMLLFAVTGGLIWAAFVGMFPVRLPDDASDADDHSTPESRAREAGQ